MNLISESVNNKLYRDGRRLLKIGPSKKIAWEASILSTISNIPGVPSVEGVTGSMDDPNKSVLVMSYLPGDPLSKAVPGIPVEWILSSLHNIIVSCYTRSIAHMSIIPEHILSTPDGVVSLVGFSNSRFLLNASYNQLLASPDISGTVNNKLFSFYGPENEENEVIGGFEYISKFLINKEAS